MVPEEAGPDGPIRVVVVDDHEMIRDALRAAIEDDPRMAVVGDADGAIRGLAMVRGARPDIAVIDVQLPDGSGIDVCRTVAEEMPDVKCIVLTSVTGDEALVAAVRAGASAYLVKHVRTTELLRAIRRVADGEALLDPRSARAVRERAAQCGADPLAASLSPQELRLIELLAQGKTNREIAGEMFLAEKTVKNYVSSVLTKLGMGRRSEAAAHAARLTERRRALGPVVSGEAIRF